MANIMTRAALSKIMTDEALSPEQRTEQVMSLYGRALDDGYISKTAAQTAQETALQKAQEEWQKGFKAPDPKESNEYKALQSEFDSYKTMQTARNSDDFRGVKPKFFETVYSMVKREDGAKPITDQLSDIRKEYEEYFIPETKTDPKPSFGAPTDGSMPKGEEGAVEAFSKAWGFVPKR